MAKLFLYTSLAGSLSLSAWCQPMDLRIDGVTSTQAILSYVPPNGNACSVEVSETGNFTPVVDDVNGVLFPGATSDGVRAVVSAGRRMLIVGRRKAELGSDGKMHSRALRADTQHFVRVTCGTGVTTNFVTAQIHGIAPEGLPFQPEGFGNFGFPDRDLSSAGRGKPLIDPQTGAASYMITNPKDYSHVGDYTFATGIYFGGTGWTNPGNVTAGSTGTLAATASTNPIFVPMQPQDAFIFGNYGSVNQDGILVDAGLHMFGSGTDSTAGNRQVQVCLSVDSGQSCYTSSVTVTLPTGSADVGTLPATFPVAGSANAAWSPFVGWGKAVPRTFIAQGTANVTAGVLNVTSSGFELPRAIINLDWAVGSKVFVAGSSPACASNYCTIASIQNGRQMTLAETGLTIANAAWRFRGLGFRIVKTNATGSVSLSASYKIAKSYAMEAGAETGCSPSTVTTNVDRTGAPISPGIVGRLCVFDRLRAGAGAIYFVGETVPEFRLISLGRFPTTPPAGHDNNDDWVFAAGPRLPANPTIFDTTDANTFYIGSTTNAGYPSIFKGVYTGDYRERSGLFFAAGNDTGIYTYVNDGITWTNVTKHSAGQDLRARILGSSSTYSEPLWGSLSSGLTFAGIANNHAVFYKLVGAQDNACWIFTFNARTGAYVTSWNTVRGGGAAGDHFGGCHAALVLVNKVVVANNGLRFSNPGVLYGGPFQATPTHVYRSGALSTNTALPSQFNGSYDGACPADIEQRWKDMGATGNNCVTVRFSTEPCSGFATAAEKAATPCPGDPSKSYIGVTIGPGAEMYDPGAGDADSEHFLMVKRTNVSGNSFDAVLLRNAGNSYCCLATPGKLPGQCAQIVSQTVHSTGWAGSFLPRGSCTTVVQFTSPNDASSTVAETSIYMRGHFSLETTSAGQINFVGTGGATGYQARYKATPADIGKYNAFGLAFTPSFAGAQLGSGTSQSYVSPGFAGIGIDWRHPNGSFGQDIEIVGQTIGPALTITPVSGQAHTYKVAGFTAPLIKAQPLMVWAGSYNFGDMSSPATGNVITDANSWKYCYSRRANECRAGASAGDLYVAAPTLDISVTTCNASQVAQNILCVMPADPVLAQVIQMDATRSDISGARVRRLGLNNTNPGAQYVYSHARPFSETQPFKLFATQYNQGGVWTGGALIDAGGWSQLAGGGNDYVKVPVQGIAVAGATHARVRFGYADYGVVGTNFYCTSRAEDCLTDATASPFSFAGDTLVPTACASGCTIPVPAIPGRVLVFRVEHLTGGAVTSVDALQLVAVP